MNGGVENKFGIEIETVGLSKLSIAIAIQSVVGGAVVESYNGVAVTMLDGRIWNVVRDGSLSGFENGEIVSPILTVADMDNLQSIVRAVRAAGAKVDESCGIHVHVDGSKFDAKTLANLVAIVAANEKMFHQSLGVTAHRAARYAKPVDAAFLARLEAARPKTLAAFQAAWYGLYDSPSRYHGSRYHGLNLNSFFYRGTVEFRYFNGSLHAGEIKTYVQLVLALASKALTTKVVSKRRVQAAVSERRKFQFFLYHLGMRGAEFGTARHHLTKRLPETVAVAA